ncbi:MAG TPA: 16S rRNA (cytidine(1402)-2'-O)-methyltransferase [Bacteroidetes bacterium]|nr:16S rRNA (cytidine(1402)-2'-O)-methyltransferase [Bacteroidota bacterium]HEX05291.1 16S rRNA (cytidine(1402)-2'-O)-methyltransferase [Bacteroidota bacterium]
MNVVGQKEDRIVEAGTLYVVATPIGHLGDISERGLQVLREVDLIAAEDTRHTGRLLARFGIETKLRSYHDHNERKVAPGFVKALQAGTSIAMVSDAGTPGVSDPGYRLLSLAAEQGVPIVPIPGPSALLAALVVAGLPMERFAFEGFLPKKKGRHTRLQELTDEPRTFALFESPQRLARTLSDLAEYLGEDRRSVICRELTKLHEEVVRGTLGELAETYADQSVKGEITLVVEGRTRRVRKAVNNTEI